MRRSVPMERLIQLIRRHSRLETHCNRGTSRNGTQGPTIIGTIMWPTTYTGPLRLKGLSRWQKSSRSACPLTVGPIDRAHPCGLLELLEPDADLVVVLAGEVAPDELAVEARGP